jgi:hypothetical protein
MPVRPRHFVARPHWFLAHQEIEIMEINPSRQQSLYSPTSDSTPAGPSVQPEPIDSEARDDGTQRPVAKPKAAPAAKPKAAPVAKPKAAAAANPQTAPAANPKAAPAASPQAAPAANPKAAPAANPQTAPAANPQTAPAANPKAAPAAAHQRVTASAQTPSSRTGPAPDAASAPTTHGDAKPRLRRSADASSAATSASFTIFGTDTAPPPDTTSSLQQREQRVTDYADRVKTQIANIEPGGEAQRNVNFLNARPFMTPPGYFSAGLLAAGVDPNREIKARFNHYVGQGRPQTQTSSSERTYRAWEIASGQLEHDRPQRGGVLNFDRMHMNPADAAMVKDLETLGARLQERWDRDVAAPLQDPSGPLAVRSGKADAYSRASDAAKPARQQGSFRQDESRRAAGGQPDARSVRASDRAEPLWLSAATARVRPLPAL